MGSDDRQMMFSVITRCAPSPGNIAGRDARFLYQGNIPRDGDRDVEMGESHDPGLAEKVVKGTVHARALGILENGSEPFGDVDAELRDLVARCMCEDPGARPALAQLEAELARGLDAAIRAEAEQAEKRADAAGGADVAPAPRKGPGYLRGFVQYFFRDAPALPSDEKTWLPSETPPWICSDDMQGWNAVRACDSRIWRLSAPESIPSTPELTFSAGASAGAGTRIRTMFESVPGGPWVDIHRQCQHRGWDRRQRHV